MRLTDKEMKLSNLEYSVTYSGVMVGEVVLFRLNSNINNAQTKILYKEIIRRINAFEEGGLVDELRTALEKASRDFYYIHQHPKDAHVDSYNFMEKAKAALAKS